jgi:chromosome partitioning protein
METSKILSIANQKGGTGKSTAAINLSKALAESGHRVLCADMDPQANLSMGLGIERPDELTMTMHEVLARIADSGELPTKSEYIMRSGNLDVIPSNINLSVTEINLRNELGGERILSELLEPLRADYDYIVLERTTNETTARTIYMTQG